MSVSAVCLGLKLRDELVPPSVHLPVNKTFVILSLRVGLLFKVGISLGLRNRIPTPKMSTPLPHRAGLYRPEPMPPFPRHLLGGVGAD